MLNNFVKKRESHSCRQVMLFEVSQELVVQKFATLSRSAENSGLFFGDGRFWGGNLFDRLVAFVLLICEKLFVELL